jgi:hypothetical protein
VRSRQTLYPALLEHPVELTAGTAIAVGDENMLVLAARGIYLVGYRGRDLFGARVQIRGNGLQIHLRPLPELFYLIDFARNRGAGYYQNWG